MYGEFILLGFLIFCNAFFSLAEVVLIAAKRSKIDRLVAQKNKRAITAAYLMDRPELFLSTVQISITLVALLFGYYSLRVIEPYVEQVIGWVYVGQYIQEITSIVVAIFATYVVTLFAELVPKKIGLVYADHLVLAIAYPIYFFLKLFYPLVWILSKSSSSILKFLKIKEQHKSAFTEFEIKSMLNESHKQGNIDENEKEIIHRIFSLGDRNITSLMTHRQHLVFLQTTDTIKQAKAAAADAAHYQYPVCKGDLDAIKGVVTLKQLYSAKDDKKKLSSIMQKPILVPETVSVYTALEWMKKSRQRNCFVVNEYGSVEGMLTLTHILEAMVGDIAIPDNEDQGIIPTKEGQYLVDGSVSFYDFLSYFDKEEYHNSDEEETDEYDTIAGFLLYEMERIPNEGDQLSWKEFTFVVADMDGHKIDKLLVSYHQHVSPKSTPTTKE